MGRYYALTPDGEAAWERIRDEVQRVGLIIQEELDAETRPLVDAAHEQFGDGLLGVALVDDGVATLLYMRKDPREEYSKAEIEQGLRNLVYKHSWNDEASAYGELRSEVKQFPEFVVLRLYPAAGPLLTIGLAPECDLSFPTDVDRFHRLMDGTDL